MTLQPIEPWPGDPRPVGMTRHYTGRQAARMVGLSWERFRKVRKDWTRDRDFPAELNEPGEPPRYLADAVDRWLERRSRRVHAAPERPVVSPPADTAATAAAHGRRQLRRLKGAI